MSILLKDCILNNPSTNIYTLLSRLRKHGNTTTVLTRGVKKTKSDSHKKRVKKAYIEKRKQQLIDNPKPKSSIKKAVGRPRKNIKPVVLD